MSSNLPSGNERDSLAPYTDDSSKPIPTETVKVWIAFEIYVEVKENYTDADLEDACELWAKKYGLQKPVAIEDLTGLS